MNYSEVKYYDTANGIGVRTTLFVSGCRRHCKECFNECTWSFSYGKPFDGKVQEEILESLAPDYIDGLTLLGGEPFEPENQRALLPFLHMVRERYPKKSIWAFSGDTWEEIRCGEGGGELAPHLKEGHARCEVTDEILSLLDLLVDGPFILEQKDLTLRFRGSRNQRILDVPASLREGRPVPADLPYARSGRRESTDM